MNRVVGPPCEILKNTAVSADLMCTLLGPVSVYVSANSRGVNLARRNGGKDLERPKLTYRDFLMSCRGELKKKMEHAMAHPEDINKVAEVQKQVRAHASAA